MENIIMERRKTLSSICDQMDKLLWLAKATGKDDDRPGIYQRIHVNMGICYATDGHRMHVFDQDQDELPPEYILQDGDYLIKSMKKNQIVLQKMDKNDLSFSPYPDVNHVLNYTPHNGIPEMSMYRYHENSKFDAFIRHLYTHFPLAFNMEYLKDALMDGKIHFEHTKPNKEDFLQPLIFGNETQFAVVMPIKVERA